MKISIGFTFDPPLVSRADAVAVALVPSR